MIDELRLDEIDTMTKQIKMGTTHKIRLNIIGLVLIGDFPALEFKLTIYTCTEVDKEIINTNSTTNIQYQRVNSRLQPSSLTTRSSTFSQFNHAPFHLYCTFRSHW